MNFPQKKTKRFCHKSQSSSGQIVVEYVLLLVVIVGLAATLTSAIVSRSESPGFLMIKWQKIINAIGADMPDDMPADAE